MYVKLFPLFSHYFLSIHEMMCFFNHLIVTIRINMTIIFKRWSQTIAISVTDPSVMYRQCPTWLVRDFPYATVSFLH
jgi:hypothetical protein